jgi:DnaJ-class molecular chaperone
MNKDYYKILGVEKTATEDEIKSAYRKLAMKWHPDRNPDNVEEAKNKFAEINEAYEVLSNPEKRQQYDNPSPFGDFGGMGGGTARQWTDENGNMHFEFNGGGMPGGFGFGNPFMDAFGMGGFGPFGRRRVDPNAPRPGESMIFTLSVGFREAIDGCSKKVRLNIEDNCGCLNGCDKCNHTGRITKAITLEVKVPMGCPDGQRLRIAGQGNRGYNGGQNGDIYFQIDISEDPDGVFIRDGFDLLQQVSVPFETFILGGEIEYHTLTGVEKHTVQPFTKPGKVLLFSDKGVPIMGSINSRGDLKVLLDLKMPASLTDKERELLEKYREERSRNGK